ncbi:MAG: hypothetical protein GYB33_12300 [Gammaproteobacteria bacterium]|nr:hypothetical protein [Gammaproteobacteria bacterium]
MITLKSSACCTSVLCWTVNAAVASVVLLLLSCTQTQTKSAEPLLDPLGVVELIKAEQAVDPDLLLDVGVQVFTVSADKTKATGIGEWIFAEILEIESQYLPTVLRNSLVQSNQWGTVRVLPRQDPSIDLQVTGTIVQSDGLSLQLNIRAHDSTGKEWLNKDYTDVNADEAEAPTSLQLDHNPEQEDPFQNLYNQIANDLLAVKNAMAASQLRNIKRVSELLYAIDLSPETFAPLVASNPDGTTRVVRLLAADDPMLDRVARMRHRHHLFIDTVDEYYAAMHLETRPVYDLWRLYSREQMLVTLAEERLGKSVSNRAGGFALISNRYDRYNASKIFEQEWTELASGFTGEIAPAILALNSRVYGLTGSVEQQYLQWRDILRQIYIEERGP